MQLLPIQILAVLSWPDWVVVAASGAFVIGIGVYCARQQTDLKEYFTASGNMGSLVVGISLYATLLSTISYLSTPGEIIKHGPAILCMLLSLPVAYWLVGFYIIPRIMRYRVTSAYEILEKELGPQVRTLGALMFVCLRLSWMGLILYMTARALVVLVGWTDAAVPGLVAGIGVVTIAYTGMGGLRAVILTDVFQFVSLLLGVLLVIVMISWSAGGITMWWPHEWVTTWDRPSVWSLDPRERISVIGVVLLGTQWWVCTAASDQSVIQRYMAVRDTKAARRMFLINASASALVTGILALVGLALLSLYSNRPELLPVSWTVQDNADELFPRFISEQLPMGIAGLVIAGLFAAGMSSVSSGVNAVAAVLMSDLGMSRASGQTDADSKGVLHARYLVYGIGIVMIAAGLVVGWIPGNFLEASQKVTNLLVAPLFGLFFMALYVRWATAFGTIVGAIYGIGTAVLVAYWDVLTGHPGLGFQWIGLYSLVVQITVGCVASWACIDREGRLTPRLLVSTVPMMLVYTAVVTGAWDWLS